MKKMMFSFLCILLLTGMVFAGGGQQGTAAPSASATGKNWITAPDIKDMPQTTIRYWYYETPERIALGQKQVADFMKKYPNITVQGSTAPDNTDNEMLMPYIQSRTNSNIHQSVCIEDLWYVTHGLLYPVNNFPDFKQVMARFDPDLNYTWKDGNTYSISWYFGPNVMFYNKKYMQQIGWDPSKPPQTYSEYLDFAKKVTNTSQNRYALCPWMGEEWWRWQFTVYPMYIAATGSNQLVSTDGKKAIFNNPNSLKVLQFFETMFKNGWAAKDNYDVDPFISGIAASTRGQADLIRSIKESAPPDFDYVLGPMPIPDGNTRGKYDTYGFVRNFAIIDELGAPEGEARDRVRRASWEFMKYLLSDEQIAADFSATGDLPCLENATSNPLIKPVFDSYGAKMQQLMQLGSNSVIFDMNSIYGCEIGDPLTQAYLKVAYGQMSAADALAWAEQQANNILAGN